MTPAATSRHSSGPREKYETGRGGGLVIFASVVLTGNPLARWFGVVVVGLNAIGQMFFLTSYPFWSLLIIVIDVVALYALCVYDSRSNLGTARPA